MNFYLKQHRSTTFRSEWLGLVCALVWFLCSVFCYYKPFFSGTWTVLTFMLTLCVSLAGFSLFFEKRPELRNRILLFTTIPGAIATGFIPFFHASAGAAVFFWLSAVLMAPLLCRRLYGILITARERVRIRSYISAIALSLLINLIWLQMPLSYFYKFPILSLCALLGLYGSGAYLPKHKRQEFPGLAKRNIQVLLIKIALVFTLLVFVNLFSTLIHAHALLDSLNDSNLFSVMMWAVVPTSFIFFSFFSDYKRNRLGFIIGMALILIGCFAALAPDGGVFTAPLLLAGGFGGTITEFCFLTMPLLFFDYSKTPQFVAVSGLILHTILSSAISWTQKIWLPEDLLCNLSRSVIIVGTTSVMILMPLALSIWRERENVSLMSALLDIKKQPVKQGEILAKQSDRSLVANEQDSIGNMEWLQLDLIESEYKIALLLCEGLSRAEISEQMGMQAAEVAGHISNIRKKLKKMPPLGQSSYVREASQRYGLTSRETEVFGELILGRSNAEISANLYIEESTVKTHVNKIMKKTGMSNRAELIAGMHAEKNESCSSDAPISHMHEQ